MVGSPPRKRLYRSIGFSVPPFSKMFSRKRLAAFLSKIVPLVFFASLKTEKAMDLYKRFRGGEPTINALLERDGIKAQVIK